MEFGSIGTLMLFTIETAIAVVKSIFNIGKRLPHSLFLRFFVVVMMSEKKIVGIKMPLICSSTNRMTVFFFIKSIQRVVFFLLSFYALTLSWETIKFTDLKCTLKRTIKIQQTNDHIFMENGRVRKREL